MPQSAEPRAADRGRHSDGDRYDRMERGAAADREAGARRGGVHCSTPPTSPSASISFSAPPAIWPRVSPGGPSSTPLYWRSTTRRRWTRRPAPRAVLRERLREVDAAREFPITSVRAGAIPGTHVLTYDGPRRDDRAHPRGSEPPGFRGRRARGRGVAAGPHRSVRLRGRCSSEEPDDSASRDAGPRWSLPSPTRATWTTAALRALVDWQIAEGIDFLVPCGSTGEAQTHGRRRARAGRGRGGGDRRRAGSR